MAIQIRSQLVISRDRTSGEENTCTSITIHETANVRVGANAQAHADLQSNGNPRSASWHIQVDDKEAIRSFPDEVECWHSGTTEGNSTSIAIEICVNADGDYDKALANAAEVVTQLREKHGLGRDALRQHSDWNGKNCPSRLRAIGGWAEFAASTDPDTAVKPPKAGNDGKGAAATGGGKSVAAMATEVIAGLHGNGHENRRRSLGISMPLYTQVRTEVNRRASSQVAVPAAPTTKSISQMANEVIDGRHGNGHDARRKSLGVSIAVYERVRAEVNRRAVAGPVRVPLAKTVSQMATEVIDGRHGNGHVTRRRSLGISAALYETVRAEVNRRSRRSR